MKTSAMVLIAVVAVSILGCNLQTTTSLPTTARQEAVTESRVLEGKEGAELFPLADAPNRLYLNSNSQRIGLPQQRLQPKRQKSGTDKVWALGTVTY
jgi:hypothetical protein